MSPGCHKSCYFYKVLYERFFFIILQYGYYRHFGKIKRNYFISLIKKFLCLRIIIINQLHSCDILLQLFLVKIKISRVTRH